MISPLPGATIVKPGSATFPLPGIAAEIVDDAGKAVGIPGGGYLVLDAAVAVDAARHLGRPASATSETYWSTFAGRYFAGDGAKRDDEGYFWLLGRVDDIMLVAGHNISTTEVESALVDHPAVAEAAVVGRTDDDDRSGHRRVRHPARRHRADRRARRRVARSRRQAHRPDREAQVDPLHRRAPQDPLGQDHAPAPAQRGRGRGARRHDHARRSRQSSTASRRGTSPPHPRSDGEPHAGADAIPPRALDLARRAGRCRARRSSSTSTACSPTRRAASTTSRRPRQDWRAFFDACGEDPVIEEVRTLLDLLDAELRIVLLTARRTGCTT